MDGVTAEVVALLALAAFAAGFVDAVVGGGGLVQLPALLLGLPQASTLQLLATNKLSSISGTTIASVTYYRRVRPSPRTFLPLMAAAFAGSFGGVLAASLVPRSAFDPVVLVVMVLVGAYVWFRPDLGTVTRLRYDAGRHVWAVLLVGAGVGFYDGALGPGTGSFFVFLLVGVLGYSFLDASANARLANWATNLGSLVLLVPLGAVVWQVALPMAACNVLGGYAGARVAVSRGARFVRVFFLVVVTGFVVRIGGSLVGVW